MKKIVIIISIMIILLIVLLSLPYISINKDNKLIYISYSDNISKYEDYTCYHESVSYNEKKNISIVDININKYFIFYVISLEYKKGNLCETEYLLEESYIKDFIDRAEIIDNSKNINIKKLIEGKNPIIGNTKYLGNDYETSIEYKLDDKYEIMYIFYEDDLLIIQVGNPDETTKFIAYK